MNMKDTRSPYQLKLVHSPKAHQCDGCMFQERVYTKGISLCAIDDTLSQITHAQHVFDCSSNTVYVLAHTLTQEELTTEQLTQLYKDHRDECQKPTC